MDTTHRHDGSEPDLLEAVAAGDLASFERLYRLYDTRVFHYVRTFVRDQAIAEEIVGDVMMAVWHGAGTFSRTARVSTWIFGIARHKALDALRRSSRYQRDTALDSAIDLPHTGESPADCAHRRQIATLTQRALTQLSVDHQEILRLVFHEELPYEEIATLLSIPINTVKTRVYYAKQHLKQQLERLGQKESV
jgi:RNA polymerase sigma-70 factor, ECF subfamily